MRTFNSNFVILHNISGFKKDKLMKKRILLILSLSVLFLQFIGCGNETAPSGKITGKVINYKTGVGLEGATVKTGGKVVTTAADGSYILAGISNATRIVVSVSKNGFAPTSKITRLSDTIREVTQDLSLLPVEFTGQFDAVTGFTAQVPGSSATVTIAPSSLVDSAGNTPTEDITAELTTINPALDINLMPGDMTISGGDPIASYGAMTVNFSDTNGDSLNLNNGDSAIVRIPVSSRGGVTPPNSIPLFYYDEIKGVWVEEGIATLSSDKTYYEGTVTHFSTWNADYLYESEFIQGCVEDENGTRVIGAVVIMNGFDYNGMTSTMTNGDGNFSVSAMRNSISLVYASTYGKVSNTVKTSVSQGTVSLSDCLVLGNVPLTVRLTWGENPSDLDTHVIGPNDYHVWYSDKGNLTENPFANLDVDDTMSYGPEVFTALKFPQAGTYHYAVYHYSGSSTITDSPARVELVLDGRRTIFTPPAGQTNNDTWWNVFDIIVNDSGAINILHINTWSSDAPNSAFLGKFMMPRKVK